MHVFEDVGNPDFPVSDMDAGSRGKIDEASRGMFVGEDDLPSEGDLALKRQIVQDVDPEMG